MKLFTLGCLMLLLSGAAQADKLSLKARTIHYLKSQAFPRDSLFLVPIGADTWTSINCQRVPGCQEQNPLFGHHPSEHKMILITVGYSGLEITGEHLIAKYWGKPIPWMFNTAFATSEIFASFSNEHDTVQLSRANTRLK